MPGLTAIIADDNPAARRLLTMLLHEYAPAVQLLGTAATAEEAAALIRQHRPSVVFLDIEMPGYSGLQLPALASPDTYKYQIVFTTAYNEYAVQAFRLSACDYLIKPIQGPQLAEAVARVAELHRLRQPAASIGRLTANLQQPPDSQRLAIPSADGYRFVPLDQLLYIAADGAYTLLHLTGGEKILVSKNLRHFEQQLEGHSQFFRIHRSYIVHTGHVLQYVRSARSYVIMADNQEIEVARNRKQAFADAMLNAKA